MLPAELRACQSTGEVVAAGDFAFLNEAVDNRLGIIIACPFCGTKGMAGPVAKRAPLTVHGLVRCSNGHRYSIQEGIVVT